MEVEKKQPPASLVVLIVDVDSPYRCLIVNAKIEHESDTGIPEFVWMRLIKRLSGASIDYVQTIDVENERNCRTR